jgi:hypothetical protein
VTPVGKTSAERMRDLRARRRLAAARTVDEMEAMMAGGAQLPLAGIVEARDQLLARYSSPLVAWAEIANRPVELLAAELSCTKLEAMQVQMRALENLAPYLHQRQPLALQADGAAIAPIVLGISVAAAARVGAEGNVLEIVADQAVSTEVKP